MPYKPMYVNTETETFWFWSIP